MKIQIGSDHAGFGLKTLIAGFLSKAGHKVSDSGAGSASVPVDYPDFAAAVARAVASGKAERGIVICGSGVGACITANKFKGVRAAICHDTYSARQGVEHDDMNVLCLGARIIGEEPAKEITAAFLGAKFSGEERHLRRLNKVKKYEGENFK